MTRSRSKNSPPIQIYLSEIRRFPVLSQAQEQSLAEGLRERRPASLETLVQSNLSFVVKMAGKYRHLGLPLEDLLSEGNVGLLEAARRYDTSKGARFISYAVWWIRKAMLKAALDHATLVHQSAYQLKKRRRISDASSALTQKLGRQPERSEIGSRTGQGRAGVEDALCHQIHEISLDARPEGRRGSSLGERLADERSDSAERTLIRGEAAALLRLALQTLSQHELRVVNARFGLDGGKPLTLRELGAAMGLSRERVRQIEKHAKRKIGEFLEQHSAGLRRRGSRPRSALTGEIKSGLQPLTA